MADTTLPGVLLKGVAASRPAATAVAKGTIYSATDTGAISQSDGSSWSSFAQAGGSTAAPQFSMIELGNASDTTLSRASAGVVAVEGTNLVKAGAATGSGLTMATSRLLGRTTASSGAIEEITVGTGLSLSGGSLQSSGSAAPIATGTSNPGSPATNDLFFRTDLGLIIYYNGTRWLTIQQYSVDAAMQVALMPVSANFSYYGPLPNGSNDLWIETIYSPTQVGATNDGSNYWTVQYKRYPSGTSIGSSFNTSADTAGTATGHTVTVNALSGTTDRIIELGMTKTGSPGSAYAFGAVFTYRKVIT